MLDSSSARVQGKDIPTLDVYLLILNYNVASSLVFQVPIKWPQSREEVWKLNIPHTHLAQEKSDQNWMVVKGEKIFFPGGGTHFHKGADKYIAAIANVRLAAPL